MTVLEAIRGRRSIRKYSPKAIEKEKMAVIYDVLRLAPSAKNIQPWHYIVVDDDELLAELVVACNSQKFIATAPLVIVGCADEKLAYDRMGGYMSSFAIDLSIGFDHLTLAAYELGLGTCWIGSFKEKEVKSLLNIPDNLRVVALTPVGYPAGTPPTKPRKEWSEISSHNKFGE